jgi:hypothetical protein
MRYLAPGRGFWAAYGYIYYTDLSGHWTKQTGVYGWS